MQKNQKEIIDQFQKKELKRKVPQHVVIKIECKGEKTYEKRSYDSEIKEVIRQQQEIEIHLMLQGFLAKRWMTALEKVGASHPERWMNTL